MARAVVVAKAMVVVVKSMVVVKKTMSCLHHNHLQTCSIVHY